MSNLIENFGRYMGKEIYRNPSHARQLLLAAYRLDGFYEKHFPDKRKPYSRQFAANACIQQLIDALSHPDETALVSIFLPCELLAAFDIHPLCAEMFATFMTGTFSDAAFVQAAENAGIAETFCSYHKILMGAALTDVLPRTGYILNTSLACDANNLTFRALCDHMHRDSYYLDIPWVKNDESVNYVADDLRRMASFLEQQTGRKLDQQRLKDAVERSYHTIANMRRALPLRATRYLSGDMTSELYEVVLMHTGLGREDALHYSELLLRDYQQAPQNTGKKILWMHTNPYWQQSAQDLLNFREDVHIVATELSYDNFRDIDPSDPWRYMAARLVYDPYNGPITDRIAYTRQMADTLQADGIVLFCHWGCRETCGASPVIQRQLEQDGYPVLVLNGDGCDRHNSSAGQTSTRLAAFIEMLEAQS